MAFDAFVFDAFVLVTFDVFGGGSGCPNALTANPAVRHRTIKKPKRFL